MSAKPKIMISFRDYDRLYAVLDKLPISVTTELLADELERAQLVDDGGLPPTVVAMHSTVMFTLLATKKSFTYKLVYPHEATSNQLLSILTPVGSALIGLSAGQEIQWPLDNGRSTTVRIDKVVQLS